MKYNYETVGTDCLIGLFFTNYSTLQITQRINDSHYLCSVYENGELTEKKFIYSLKELIEYRLWTNIEGAENGI